ncbi:MAG: formylmethanofuran dehydrogenase subunit A, partial [Planctomycetota bacterium]
LRADDRAGEANAVRRRVAPADGGAVLRSGTLGSVPSTFAAAYKYAALGYTTAFDAAVSPLGARQAHQELADTPCIDKGFYCLFGNNHYAMRRLADGQSSTGQAGDGQSSDGRSSNGRLRSYLAWLLGRTKAFAPKLVNPGGVEVWKQGGGHIEGIDDTVPGFDVSPRRIIEGVARAANDLGLPHPVHLHCNQLGMPGNWRTTLDSMHALDGMRAHIAHVQFHSYGGGGRPGGDNGDEQSLCSRVAPLAEHINANPNLTVDVGQVMFGPTTTMTADSPLSHYLHRTLGGRWATHDSELESGCGVTPIEYKNRSRYHALQWAVGLEWYLLVNDPWQVVMSTDHPNGGTFLAYPEIIRLLMDRSYRADVLATCPDTLPAATQLADLDREYTLGEIAVITRAGPARILGLANKGHLGPGADADVTLYTPSDNPAEMFSLPRHVLKAGELIIENGELRSAPTGKTLHVEADYDRAVVDDFAAWFNANASIRFANYGVEDWEVGPSEAVIAGG